MPTLLIADDDENILDTLEDVLVQEGYEVHKAKDGDQALEILRKEKIDLLLVDIFMPEVDGLELVRRLRNDNPELPFITMSGQRQNYAEQALKIMGAKAMLAKPFDNFEVCDLVEDILANSKNHMN